MKLFVYLSTKMRRTLEKRLPQSIASQYCIRCSLYESLNGCVYECECYFVTPPCGLLFSLSHRNRNRMFSILFRFALQCVRKPLVCISHQQRACLCVVFVCGEVQVCAFHLLLKLLVSAFTATDRPNVREQCFCSRFFPLCACVRA